MKLKKNAKEKSFAFFIPQVGHLSLHDNLSATTAAFEDKMGSSETGYAYKTKTQERVRQNAWTPRKSGANERKSNHIS